jgi:hypothetical protein
LAQVVQRAAELAKLVVNAGQAECGRVPRTIQLQRRLEHALRGGKATLTQVRHAQPDRQIERRRGIGAAPDERLGVVFG